MKYIIASSFEGRTRYLVSMNEGYEWSEDISEAKTFRTGSILSTVNELCIDEIEFQVLKQQT